MTDNGKITVIINGQPLLTPKKHSVSVPTQALADAIADEWSADGLLSSVIRHPSSAAKRPLTSIAYTAIDQIAHQPDLIVESLLTYVDTDALSYRATGSEALATQQMEQWNPVLEWIGHRLDAKWEVTSGVMPVDQSPGLHKAIEKKLKSLDTFRLAAACVLASGFSSLALMLAVLEKHIKADKAFMLSRLEEESQAEQWGRDDEAQARAEKLKSEIMTASEFLSLLEAK